MVLCCAMGLGQLTARLGAQWHQQYLPPVARSLPIQGIVILWSRDIPQVSPYVYFGPTLLQIKMVRHLNTLVACDAATSHHPAATLGEDNFLGKMGVRVFHH
uniref:Uncharacterized protein n=1 Tax=Oryza sativa subsp. japonica TaxID=39947 RepID=Q75I38_ORYSJ|nr:hypothetical protein [Oryza sativa Japonica Group]